MSATKNKVLNHDAFDYANSAIINPNTPHDLDKEREGIRKETCIVVDSRLRDTQTFPSPSKYVFDLHDDIQDVVSAELHLSEIPFKTYLINKSNSGFFITIEGTMFKILIEQGDYEPSELASVLETELSKYMVCHVDYYPRIDKFAIYGEKSFSLDFDRQVYPYKPHHLGKVLGFPSKKIVSVPNTLYTDTFFMAKAEFRKNFNEKNYILLKIAGFNVHHSTSPIIDKTFALIPENKLKQNVISSTNRFVKFFNPPIARLTRLQISFVDQNGELADFQNHDHYFILRFESYRHIRKYATFLDMK